MCVSRLGSTIFLWWWQQHSPTDTNGNRNELKGGIEIFPRFSSSCLSFFTVEETNFSSVHVIVSKREMGLRTVLKRVPQWMSDTLALLLICCLDVHIWRGRKTFFSGEKKTASEGNLKNIYCCGVGTMTWTWWTWCSIIEVKDLSWCENHRLTASCY